MKLTDALSDYLASHASGQKASANQDLYRFGRWTGWERSVAELTPSEVAKYGEEAALAGGDVQGHLASVKEFLGFLKREGLTTQSLASHIKVRRANKLAAGGARPGIEAISMTADGHHALSEELQMLKGERVNVAETIRAAAADKDFSENAPLDAAREQQGKMEARIRELEEMLRRAVVLGTAGEAKAGVARVGSTVVFQDIASGKDGRYLLVDSSEADPASGKISVVSPVGKALVGSHPGDDVEVSAPKGVLRYRIVSVGQ